MRGAGERATEASDRALGAPVVGLLMRGAGEPATEALGQAAGAPVVGLLMRGAGDRHTPRPRTRPSATSAVAN